MDCSKVLETAYEEESASFFSQVQVWLHTLFCQSCAQKIELYHSARTLMRQDFLSSGIARTINNVNIEESIMAKIAKEEFENEPNAAAGILSTRGWIITGIVIFVSFATAFFGMDFKNVANETGSSFLLPIGILFGIVLTTYCAFFIGSHLKELTEHFGL